MSGVTKKARAPLKESAIPSLQIVHRTAPFVMLISLVG